VRFKSFRRLCKRMHANRMLMNSSVPQTNSYRVIVAMHVHRKTVISSCDKVSTSTGSTMYRESVLYANVHVCTLVQISRKEREKGRERSGDDMKFDFLIRFPISIRDFHHRNHRSDVSSERCKILQRFEPPRQIITSRSRAFAF